MLVFDPYTPCHGISLSPDETEIYLIDVANAYVHVFNVSGLPNSAPVLVANVPLTTNFSGVESPCLPSFNCEREGWLRHNHDGRYVLVNDSGNVIDTTTRQVVNTIRNSSGTPIDFAGQIAPNRLTYGG